MRSGMSFKYERHRIQEYNHTNIQTKNDNKDRGKKKMSIVKEGEPYHHTITFISSNAMLLKGWMAWKID